jgi:RimJ/RimL family protein N-acetyltransferase
MPTCLEVLTPRFYRPVFEVARVCEPYSTTDVFDQYRQKLIQMEGWVFTNDSRVFGFGLISDYVPRLDATLHCSVMPDYRGKWIDRNLLKTVFGYLFIELGLPRVSGFHVPGLSDAAGRFQGKLGFKVEGCKRKGVLVGDVYHNVVWVGMLREECRWL